MKKKGSVTAGGKIITFLLVAVFLTYFIYQFLAALMPLTTGTAVYYTTYDGIQTTGTIIREERIVRSDLGGVHYFVVGDGEKVSKGGVIASIYGSQQDAQVHTDLTDLATKISSLKEVQAYNNTAAVDLDLLNTHINESLINVINSCRDGNFTDTAAPSAELLKLLNRKKISTGEEQDFTTSIAALETQYNTLKAAAPTAVGTVRSDSSGYFVSTADGLETLLNISTINTLTPEILGSITPADSGENVIGKIVSDYTWYIACPISLKESAKFKVGDSVKLKTPLKSAGEIAVTVESINLGSGDEALIVFSCNNINGDLATMRTLPITVVTGEYSGLRVSNKSVRIVDGKRGVYVISGMQAKFVEIDIVHSASGYTLCNMDNTSAGDKLRLYDEVIEKGKNIYDGKIIR